MPLLIAAIIKVNLKTTNSMGKESFSTRMEHFMKELGSQVKLMDSALRKWKTNQSLRLLGLQDLFKMENSFQLLRSSKSELLSTEFYNHWCQTFQVISVFAGKVSIFLFFRTKSSIHQQIIATCTLFIGMKRCILRTKFSSSEEG